MVVFVQSIVNLLSLYRKFIILCLCRILIFWRLQYYLPVIVKYASAWKKGQLHWKKEKANAQVILILPWLMSVGVSDALTIHTVQFNDMITCVVTSIQHKVKAGGHHFLTLMKLRPSKQFIFFKYAQSFSCNLTPHFEDALLFLFKNCTCLHRRNPEVKWIFYGFNTACNAVIYLHFFIFYIYLSDCFRIIPKHLEWRTNGGFICRKTAVAQGGTKTSYFPAL